MLALKLFGAVLVCLCGFFGGYFKAENTAARARILGLMADFLQELRTAVKYKRSGTIQMLSEISVMEKYLPIAFEICEVAAPDWPQHRADALDAVKQRFAGIIPDSELNFFCEAIVSLGESNAQQEDEMLDYYHEKLSAAAQSVQSLAKKNRKLYTGVGFFAGAAVAIILL